MILVYDLIKHSNYRSFNFAKVLSSKQRTSWSIEMIQNKALFGSLFLLMSSAGFSADISVLERRPLFQIGNLDYVGGFRLPSSTLGESNATYSEGPIALGANGESIYVVGHARDQAVAEFRIPTLVDSMNVSSMNTASVVQNFSELLDRPATGNPQDMDRIGGLEYINGQLLVNTYIYYDAGRVGSHTTLVVRDAARLSSSAIGGYHGYDVSAHGAGWISRAPDEWHDVLGGTYITGAASGLPIISRWSVGPSGFAFNPTSMLSGASSSTIPTTTLLDFSLENPLGAGSQDVSDYLYNRDRNNDLWNHMSRAAYGFIVPGTRTYMTIGSSSGMQSGVGYKITQTDGNLCGGYCPVNPDDAANYYWLWDMNDLYRVKNGQMRSYEVMPYAYGSLEASVSYPHSTDTPVIGGAYDEASGLLYLSLRRGDTNSVSWTPLIVAFRVSTPSPPLPPANPGVQRVDE